LLLAVAGDNAIWRIPLIDGHATRVTKALQLSGGVAPGGIVTDADDNLFIAQRGLGCVWMFDKRGEPRYRIDSSRGDWTTGIARDPNDPRGIFITEAQTGVVLKATLPMY
jgi:gluconolactonase